MTDDRQIGLFGDLEPPRPAVRPWIAIRVEQWQAEAGLPLDLADPEVAARAMELLYELLLRNRRLLRALDLQGVPLDAKWLERFLETERPVVNDYLLLKLVPSALGPLDEVFAAAAGACAALARFRIDLLETLDAGTSQRVQGAEQRVSVDESTLQHQLADLEIHLAEEMGLLQEISFERGAGAPSAPGFIMPEDIEGIVSATLAMTKEEQDARPLPKQGKLATLLRGLPVVWLDAVLGALEIEPARKRKESERRIAAHLRDDEGLKTLLEERLHPEERELLELLLREDGGQTADRIRQEFGDDGDDGWFWNEEPPRSTLGRLRLHALAFVGETEHLGRTVIVPKELRPALRKLIGRGGP